MISPEKRNAKAQREFNYRLSANKTHFEHLSLSINCKHNLRGSKDTDSIYISKLCRRCITYLGAEYLRIGTKITAIEFGKQDIRGGYSITLMDGYNCVYQYMTPCKTQKEFIHFLGGIIFLGRGGI